MYRLRGRRNSAMFAALLLLLLVMLAGQNSFTGLFSYLLEVRPYCASMRQAVDRNQHQSLIARAAASRGVPFRVDLVVGAYPTTADGTLDLTVTFTNATVGTVPFLFSGGIPVNNTAVDGFGIIIANTAITPAGSTISFVPDSNVRLLVPLQGCIQTVQLTQQQLQAMNIQRGTVLQAYYRNSNIGQLTNTAGGVFGDHGMWTGVVVSRSQVVSTVAQTAQ